MAPDRNRVSIALIRAFAHPHAPAPPTSVQHRRPASAESVKRRGVARAAPPRPANPPSGSRPDNLAGPGRSQRTRAAVLPCNRPAPVVVTGHPVRSRAHHRRSRVRQLVHSSITRHSAAARGERRESKRPHRGAGVLRLPTQHREGSRHVARRDPPRSAASQPVNPARTPSARPCRGTGAARRSLSSRGRTPGSGSQPQPSQLPTSHLRPTPSSPRIRLTGHPCSTCRVLR